MTGTIPAPPALQLLQARMQGDRGAYRLGRVAEGGDMRGVMSGAMLTALRGAGALERFDRPVGAP